MRQPLQTPDNKYSRGGPDHVGLVDHVPPPAPRRVIAAAITTPANPNQQQQIERPTVLHEERRPAPDWAAVAADAWEAPSWKGAAREYHEARQRSGGKPPQPPDPLLLALLDPAISLEQAQAGSLSVAEMARRRAQSRR